MKKHLWKIGIGIIVGVIVIVTAFLIMNMMAPSESERVTLAKEEQEISDIFFYGTAKQVVFVLATTVILLAILIVSYGISRSKVLKASVHTAKIGEHSEIPVKHSDLPTLSPVLTGLVTAENLKAYSQGQEKAFDMYCKLSEVQTKQIQALAFATRGLGPHTQIIEQTQEHPALPAPVPSFHDLLTTGQIAPGNPLIFGYNEAGQARSGTWVDLFSSAVAGQSGQGKTATLRSLIAQSLLTGQVETFWIADFHFPHPQSLLATLGDLKDLQAIRYVENPFDLPELLQEVEATIDRRLRMEEASTPIKVLVCDEVLILCERIPQLKQIIKRIGTEARKCGVYGLFSAQTWKADAVGGSEVRDCLTSRFAHKMQPKQANLLLQDSDQSKQVKQLSTGKALFAPVNGVSEILSIPYCDPGDMKLVYSQIVDGNTVRLVKPAVLHKPIRQPEPEKSLKLRESKSDFCDPGLDDFFTTISSQNRSGGDKIEKECQDTGTQDKKNNVVELHPKAKPDPDLVLHLLQNFCSSRPEEMSKNQWQQQVADEAGISLSLLKNVMLGHANLTSDVCEKLADYLKTVTL